MITKTKTALIAAFILGSASAALAQSSGAEIQNSAYQLNPNAQVPVYSHVMPNAYGMHSDRGASNQTLIEGRNVSVGISPDWIGGPAIEDRYPSFGGY
jgi:hypothetical protein